MDIEAWSLTVSFVALAGSVITGTLTLLQRRRQAVAAVTTDLYPVLRQLRDSAWQWAKPLGGQANDHLIAVHNGLIDLIDLAPAVADRRLREQCHDLLQHDAAGVALSIDPPRFAGIHGGPELPGAFADFAQQAHAAVERCQRSRRGIA